jgi:uncharacterized NAD-dependent epimerase/dehydratase family protein
MNQPSDGNAIVYCEGAFNTTNGKTAHGLVRFTKRYHVLSVIDSRYAGQDAGEVLDCKIKNIPVIASLNQAVSMAAGMNQPATHFVVGLAPDGGRLPSGARKDLRDAIALGLNVDCGLHDYLSEDSELAKLAVRYGIQIRDIRKPAAVNTLHFFSGKIEAVKALKIAVLGTDSAVGKRTTAWLIIKAFQDMDLRAEMIGTGQTAWMQGAKYGIIMDALINDFVAGEIEHAVWTAWQEEKPEVIVIEGQGSLMNPAYPGGFEILAAGRPDIIVLQHAPARKEYDGFPGYRIQPLARQIEAIELLSGKPVVAVTINHENLLDDQIPLICDAIELAVGLPAFDFLRDGAGSLANLLKSYLDDHHDPSR